MTRSRSPRSRPARLLVAALATTVVLVPAIVLARGGNGPSGQGNLVDQVVWSSDGAVSTNSKQFARVPTMEVFIDSLWENPVTVDVSADMISGSARFRVKGFPSTNLLRPDAALFRGKGVSSFQFFTADGDTQFQNFEVEWKRVGKAPARAANVVATVAGEKDLN
jgi:hypothetical protein